MSTSKIGLRSKSTGVPGSGPPGVERSSAADLLGEVHELTRAGRIRSAQRLVRDAAARHPEDPEIRKAHRALIGDLPTRRPRTGRSLSEEYRWLGNPPAEYRGRWVALVGREVIAAADTLEELRRAFPSDLEQTPLAVRIAS